MIAKIVKILRSRLIIPLVILIAGLIALSILVNVQHRSNLEQARQKAQLSAVTYSNRLSSDIKKGIAITETLKQILIGEEGSDINEFYTIAAGLKRDYRSSFYSGVAPFGKD